MLGLSRRTEIGGSYRTIQRLYHTVLPWNAIQWLFFRKRFLQPADEYLIIGDEVVGWSFWQLSECVYGSPGKLAFDLEVAP